MVLIPLPFDRLVSDTLSRITGVRELVGHAYNSIPGMKSRAQDALRDLAEVEHWSSDDYDAENQILQTTYEYWVPKYTAYSAIILLCSILETQLFACCERIREEKVFPFRVRDFKGSALDASALFIKNLTGVNATKDPAWQHLRDMQTVRNIIVHRGGARGEPPQYQKEFDDLVARHSDNLEARTGLWLEKELWVSIQLCDKFISEVDWFFRRLFKSLGLSD